MESTTFVERRLQDRISKAITVSFSTASENHAVEHDAVTIDWSPHGIRIGTAFPLSPGEQVLVLSHGGTPASIPARVAWVSEYGTSGGASAGLELIYSLPD